jgi:hypothetical protein
MNEDSREGARKREGEKAIKEGEQQRKKRERESEKGMGKPRILRESEQGGTSKNEKAKKG